MGRPISGFPDAWGASRASVFPHTGPASYAQITYGPAAAGNIVDVTETGMGAFSWLSNGVTDSGNFAVIAIPTSSSVGPVGTQTTTYRLRWNALRTATIGGQAQTAGAEAVATTNLSGETVRLLAVGPK